MLDVERGELQFVVLRRRSDHGIDIIQAVAWLIQSRENTGSLGYILRHRQHMCLPQQPLTLEFLASVLEAGV